MKGLFIGSGIVAVVAYAALIWGPPGTKAPLIPPAPPQTVVVQPSALPLPHQVPQAVEPLRPTPEVPPQVQGLPTETAGAPVHTHEPLTETAQPITRRGRPQRIADEQMRQVNRPVANGFTADLNRQEMQSLEAGKRAPPSGAWRELYPVR